MRATILPYAIILTKAHREAFSVIAKGVVTNYGEGGGGGATKREGGGHLKFYPYKKGGKKKF